MASRTHDNFLRSHNARHVWHPMAHPAEMEANPPRIIVSGEGVHVTDIDGRRLLDAVGGLWNVNLGYSCEPIKRAMAAQLETLPYYSAFRGTTHPGVIDLSHRLVEMTAPEDMARVFFTSGGSDSVETALRLARQYWKLEGQRDRTKFIALTRGYHGTHFGGASVNGNANFRRQYEPLMPGVFHIPAPWTYRNPFDERDPERLAEICARLLDEQIAFQGPDTVAAFIAEPVMGSGGVIVPPASFWPRVREVCDRHGVLLIADEVVTAFGRTGSLFGCRGWGVAPDFICVAKAITSGYFPLGATLINRRVADAFSANRDGRGQIGHGYTYSGHPVGCAAAMAALDATLEQDLPGRAKAEGAHFNAHLAALAEQDPAIGEARGLGLMAALELVSDKQSRTPAGKAFVQKVAELAYERDVLIRTSSNLIILSPPLVIAREEIDRIVDVLGEAVRLARG